MTTFPLDLDGYTDLPPGKLVNIATCLQMFALPPNHQPESPPHGCKLEALTSEDPDRYLTLYRKVGEPWLWFSRLDWSRDETITHLSRPDINSFVLTIDGADAGILELDFSVTGDVELAFFGLAPEAIGAGRGRYLMSEAIARAFARGSRRFWVHTCTLDHPAALGFYIRSGFIPYKRMIEMADDPRRDGRCPHAAAPHFPLLDNEHGESHR